MKLLCRLALPALVGLLAFAAAENKAHALGPVDVEIGAKIGVATNPSDGPSPFGFGLGARGGVNIFGLYAGLNVIHYFGSSDTVNAVNVSTSSTLYGVEVGYTIKAIPLLRIRPQIGVGNAHLSASAAGVDDNGTNKLYLEPGVVAIVPLGLLYVGLDANVLLVPSAETETSGDKKTYAAFTVHAQVGITF